MIPTPRELYEAKSRKQYAYWDELGKKSIVDFDLDYGTEVVPAMREAFANELSKLPKSATLTGSSAKFTSEYFENPY